MSIGYGRIRVGNGRTVRSGTYIKYSVTIGSINLNDVDGSMLTWIIVNATIKSMPTPCGIIPDAGVNVGFRLVLTREWRF